MMLATSLTLLPPPTSSLLPPNSDNSTNVQSTYGTNANPSGGLIGPTHPPPHHRRHNQKQTRNPRSTLAMLSADEKTIAQRKLAIAMYGYSWLKPAGCAKTMLGRKEEEVEREEVERQLREVEMQERAAAEVEEEERRRGLVEQNLEGERDLDDDVPDADDLVEEEVDLDAEIPSADEDEGDLDDGFDDDDNDELDEGQEDMTGDGNWTYDTRREPDTDTENERNTATIGAGNNRVRAGQGQSFPNRRLMGRPGNEYSADEHEAEAVANAMLDEDELGEITMDDYNQDQDQIEGFTDRDLDDDVPEADAEDDGLGGEWEHTDTELEDEDNQESEMDISILPETQTQIRSERRARVVSGNAALQQMQMRTQYHTPDLSSHNFTIGQESSEIPFSTDHRNVNPRRSLFNLQNTTTGSRLFTPSPPTQGQRDDQVRRSGRMRTRREQREDS